MLGNIVAEEEKEWCPGCMECAAVLFLAGFVEVVVLVRCGGGCCLGWNWHGDWLRRCQGDVLWRGWGW